MADGTGAGSSLVQRAKNILIEPNVEWDRIDAEPMTVGQIFKGWVLILAAIPAVSHFVGLMVFGQPNGFFGAYGLSVGALLTNSITMYIFIVSGVFLYGLLIDALAPTFGGNSDRAQAMKVAAFSMTPALLASIFGLLPPLALLLTFVGSLYALYLLYLGLPKLMKVPEDRTIPYIVSVIVAGVVLIAVAYALMGAVAGIFAPRPVIIVP